MLNGFKLRVRSILVKGVVDDREITAHFFFLQEYGLNAHFLYHCHIVFVKNAVAVQYDLVTLNGYYFTGVLINEVFRPATQYTGCKTAANMSSQGLLVYLHFISHAEKLQYVLICFITNCTEQCGYREFLFTVDVRVHHIVDVGSELHPCALERDNTCRVYFGSVRVNALSEEHTRRTVKLRYNHTFSAVDHKRTTWGHVGDVAQEHILYYGFKVHMLLIITAQPKLCFQWHGIRKTALHTLVDCVTWRVDEIIQELKHENVTSVRDREILLEHTEQAFIVALIRRRFQLEKILKGLKLDREQVRHSCCVV